MQPHIFSFKIFQILKLDPEIMQGLLEITNPEQRLIKVHGFLKNLYSEYWVKLSHQ